MRHKTSEVSGRLYPVVLIVAVTWVANFLHFTAFGLYEDDWYYFAEPYSRSASQWFGQLNEQVVHFFVGRPLQNLYLYLLGYTGAVFSSVPLLYVVAFACSALAAVLMYCVLRRLFPVLFCTIATLIFVLSPLTTIRQFLSMDVTLYPGFSCLFLAILLHTRRHRVWAAMVAALTLVTYESLFLPYLLAPLFQTGRRSRRPREAATHLLTCFCLFGAYFLLRRAFGEQRLTSIPAGPVETLKSALFYCLVFTAHSFTTYLYAAYNSLRDLTWEPLIYTFLFLIPAVMVAFRLYLPGGVAGVPAHAGRGFAAARRKWWAQNGVGLGLLLTLLGYGLAYFFQATSWDFPLAGRDTRVSAAASFGSSVLIAAVLHLLLTGFRSRVLVLAAKGLTLASLSVLFAYSFLIQQDYIRAWNHQKNFLTQAIMLTPDIQPDSYLVVRTSWIEQRLFPQEVRHPSIGFQRHGLGVSLQSMLGSGQAPRIAFVYSPEWTNYLKSHSDGKLFWTRETFPGSSARSLTDPITSGRVIMMSERDDGSLTRINTPILVDGQQIVQMQPADQSASNWHSFNASPLLREIVPDFVTSAKMVNTPSVPWGPLIRAEGGLILESLVPADASASIERGHLVKVITPDSQGGFAASIAIHGPHRPGRALLHLRARVIGGQIGLGLLNLKTRTFQSETTLDPSPEMSDIYIPLLTPETADQLIIRNLRGGVRSEIWIEDAGLLVSSANSR